MDLLNLVDLVDLSNLGILMILVNLVISVDMVADIIFVNFFTQAHFQKFEHLPQKSA